MLDLLASTAALLVVLALLAAAGVGVTVLPFVVAGDLAEGRGLSVPRAGTLTLLAVGAGLLGALLVLRSEDLYQQPHTTYAAVLAHLGLASQPGVTFRVHNHWADAQQQLTPALRQRLRAHFEEPNRDLARLLGWSRTWDAEPSERTVG